MSSPLYLFQPVITMNVNVDEMISYACISWTFSGQFSKVVLTPDFAEYVSIDSLGHVLTDAIIKEK